MNEYQALTKLVNLNLQNNGLDQIDFDELDNIYMDLYNISEKALLNIKDDEVFFKEVFLKLLNRHIAPEHLDSLLKRMSVNNITRKQFLVDVYNSNERKIKKTDLIFDAK